MSQTAQPKHCQEKDLFMNDALLCYILVKKSYFEEDTYIHPAPCFSSYMSEGGPPA